MKHTITNRIKWFVFVPLLILVSLFTMGKTPPPADSVDKFFTKKLDMSHVKCLATGVFFEAGSESVEGKAAVAHVIMNRVRHGFASNPCKVVYQTQFFERAGKMTKLCQFSWVCDGKSKPNERDPRYVQSLDVAFRVLANDDFKGIVPRSTLFFHSVTANPEWPYRRVSKIGNHVFYRK